MRPFSNFSTHVFNQKKKKKKKNFLVWCQNLFDVIISTRAGFYFFNWGTMKFVGRLWGVGGVDLVRKNRLVLMLVELVFLFSRNWFYFRECCSVISRRSNFYGRSLIWDQLGFSRFEILVCLIWQLMNKSTGILHVYVISNTRLSVDVWIN